MNKPKRRRRQGTSLKDKKGFSLGRVGQLFNKKNAIKAAQHIGVIVACEITPTVVQVAGGTNKDTGMPRIDMTGAIPNLAVGAVFMAACAGFGRNDLAASVGAVKVGKAMYTHANRSIAQVLGTPLLPASKKDVVWTGGAVPTAGAVADGELFPVQLDNGQVKYLSRADINPDGTIEDMWKSETSNIDGQLNQLPVASETMNDNINTLADKVNTLNDNVNTLEDNINTLEDDMGYGANALEGFDNNYLSN